MAEGLFEDDFRAGYEADQGSIQYGNSQAMMAHILLGELTDRPDDPDTGGEFARLHGPDPSDIGGIALKEPTTVEAENFDSAHKFSLVA
jgi:hypothetical protein